VSRAPKREDGHQRLIDDELELRGRAGARREHAGPARHGRRRVALNILNLGRMKLGLSAVGTASTPSIWSSSMPRSASSSASDPVLRHAEGSPSRDGRRHVRESTLWRTGPRATSTRPRPSRQERVLCREDHRDPACLRLECSILKVAVLRPMTDVLGKAVALCTAAMASFTNTR